MHNSHIMSTNAIVGSWDDDARTHVWVDTDIDIALENTKAGVWVYRGYVLINGMYYMTYYLPAPTI